MITEEITREVVEQAPVSVIPEISRDVVILPVSYAAILDDPASPTLLRAYAEDCLVPDAEPQRELYASMEQMGSIQCFGAYLDRGSNKLLIGFVSVIRTIVLHDGHLIGAVESLFVDREHRSTGAGLLLIAAAKLYATDSGCRCLLASARMGSALDTILSRRSDCDRTHTQYTFWLNGYKGGRE
jgi:GNAT superfamily N-acetyltransferase